MRARRVGQFLKTRGMSLGRSALVVAVFVVIGLVSLRGSNAATYATTAQAESGTLSGNASLVSDANASGSSAVKFGAAVTPPPPPPPSGVPVVGSYVLPGQVGYLGSLSGLTVYDSTHLPPGCNWDASEGFVCSGTLTFDHAYFRSGIYWDSDGTLTIKNSIIEGGTPNGVGKYFVRAFNTNCTVSIEDSTIRWSTAPYNYARPTATIAAANTHSAVEANCRQKMYRNDIRDADSAFLAYRDDDAYVQNYYHDVRRIRQGDEAVTHNDAVFLGDGDRILIQQNYFDLGYDGDKGNGCGGNYGGSQSAGLFWQLQPGSVKIDATKVYANFLSSGGTTLANEDGTNLDVQNNTFDDTSYFDCNSVNRKPIFGLTSVQSGSSIKTWSGNVGTSGATVPKP